MNIRHKIDPAQAKILQTGLLAAALAVIALALFGVDFGLNRLRALF